MIFAVRRGIPIMDIRAEQSLAKKLAGGVQVLANLSVIVAAGCVVWLATQRVLPGAARSPSPPPIYAIGESVGAVVGVDFRESPETLLMVLREECRYCKESVPFYQQLSAAEKDSRRIRMVVASTDAQASMSAYLQSNKVQVDRVVTVAPDSLKVPGTPCLLLVDSAGKVKKVWRGKLSVAQEREVFSVLGLRVPV